MYGQNAEFIKVKLGGTHRVTKSYKRVFKERIYGA
jgi:hypothetical protein